MRLSRVVAACALTLAMAVTAPTAHATSMLPQNLADLVTHSKDIVVGDVVEVVDGFDGRGVPFTEVTVRVDEALRGERTSTHTFRQFGLVAPRSMPDGSTYVGVSPDGWPTFRAGERVMLFLHEGSLQTGLRTTVGLGQGKFVIRDGRISNGYGNANVFHELDTDRAPLTAAQAKLVESPEAMPAEDFIDLVRTAVRERWVEEGRIVHEH